MKVLVTGVAGFLGSHLAERILNLGHQVIGIDNLEGGYLHNIPKGVEFKKGDCINFETMCQLSKGCDIVCHAACTAYEGLSVFSPFYVTSNTFQNSISTFSACIQNKVKRFIYCSSMSRYGRQNKIPFTEDMVCNPEDPYGVAKLASERVLETLANLNQIEYVILVPHNIIGPRQCFEDPYRNVAAIMINRILQGKQPIIYGDGKQQRCFSFIEDVISCFEMALFSKEVNRQIINVGPDEELITINNLCKTICKLLNINFDPIYAKGRPLEVKFAACSSDKARKLLNYKTQTSLEEGLERMIQYISEHGPKPFKYNRPIEINNDLTPLTWSHQLL